MLSQSRGPENWPRRAFSAARETEERTILTGDEFPDDTALEAFLAEYGVETSSWGVAKGTKKVGALLEELKSGFSLIEFRAGTPVRKMSVAEVRVISDDNTRTLVQKSETLPDGTVKPINRPLSQKYRPGEDPMEAIVAGVLKEFSLRPTPLDDTQSDYLSSKTHSGAPTLRALR